MGQGNIAALTAEKPAISSLPRKNDSPDAEPWKLPLLSKLERISKICCIGAGYVGVPTSAMIASKNPHIKVTVFDTDDWKIRRWASDKPEDLPIHEPGLFKLISQVKSPAPLCYDLPFEDHSDPSKETSHTLSVNNDKENFNLTYDGPLLENLFRPVLHSLQLMKSATPQGMPDDNERGIVLKETLISVETHIGMLLQDVADHRDRETLDEKYWTYIFGYWPNQRTAMPKDIKDMSFRLVESERLEDRPSAATNGHSIGPNLIFTTDGNRAIEEADLIFISVDTPTKLHGIGEGFDADLTAVEAVARQIAQVSTNSKIVVEKSTVPCGTADKIREILKANANPGVEFIVLSNPEFLVEGNALENLLAPDRVVIGSHLTKDALLAAAKLANVYEAWIPKEKIITTDLWSSELSKLVANAMLAQRISSMNAVSAICEKVGADVDEVARIVGTDSRIGDRMLKAGVGFGGSCFQKDILNLVYLSRSLNLNDVADYWERIVRMNEAQKSRFLNRIITRLNNTLMNKKIAVLGFAFKKNTADSRATPAIEIVKGLAMEHAHIDIFDPLVPESTIREEMRSVNIAVGGSFIHSKVKVVETAYEACRNAHAIVILTDWDEFRVKECSSGPHEPPRLGYRDVQLSVLHLDEHPTQSTERLQVLVAPEDEKGLDWQRIAAHMHSPKWVFDGRNFLDTAELGEMGFCVEAVGRPA